MSSEFEKQIRLLNVDKLAQDSVVNLIEKAGKEFPCLKCPSNGECENFNWFLKWFGVLS